MAAAHNKQVLKTLKPGDRVKFSRSGYSHWGIYEGNGRIIYPRYEPAADGAAQADGGQLGELPILNRRPPPPGGFWNGLL
jgi:cell wall-associated NlpC family hydrolase